MVLQMVPSSLDLDLSSRMPILNVGVNQKSKIHMHDLEQGISSKNMQTLTPLEPKLHKR